ncbi:hypothetical protein ABL78_4787 [Leptomonas seymouri]|uniref:Uncharacterized protein n=1 Tax=Leptomonas seymouri TaxID=5684 RepID=A0A0N1HW35_LEPSE|nr:hypothetical protein ABL78_4787 [Leptomonas seymouri]|eukprot:KPI86165.1 hypothetical protein ABL78_4787 [Leptomonas seymouri]
MSIVAAKGTTSSCRCAVPVTSVTTKHCAVRQTSCKEKFQMHANLATAAERGFNVSLCAAAGLLQLNLRVSHGKGRSGSDFVGRSVAACPGHHRPVLSTGSSTHEVLVFHSHRFFSKCRG